MSAPAAKAKPKRDPVAIAILAGVRKGRELVFCKDGPYVGAWYWRDEFEMTQRAAEEAASRSTAVTTTRDGRPLPDKRHYRPTNRWATHPRSSDEGRIEGRVWLYDDPAKRKAK